MGGIYTKFCNGCDNLGRSKYLSPKYFQYGCAFCGFWAGILFFVSFAIAGMIPPPKPQWTPHETVEFFRAHHHQINWGGAILAVSGMLLLPLCAAISAQMRRIPNLHYVVPILQVASGAAGVWTIIIPGIMMCVANYDLDRPEDITQALVQMFFLVTFIPWPTFLVQWMVMVNIISPLLFVPASAVHVTRSGPVGYAGAFTFWIPGLVFVVQLMIDSVCLAYVVSKEPEGGEKIVDMFPTSNRISTSTPDEEIKSHAHSSV